KSEAPLISLCTAGRSSAARILRTHAHTVVAPSFAVLALLGQVGTSAQVQSLLPELVATLPCYASSLRFAAEGNTLVTAGGGIIVWETSSWRMGRTLEDPGRRLP